MTTMGARSFWRTYNLISALGCIGMGVAFIVGAFFIPMVKVGFIFGGLVCIAVGGMLAAWDHFSKDLIPDVPMMGPTATLDALANANTNAMAMQSAVMGMSPYPVQQVQTMIPGQAVVDRADDTGFGSPMGRTMDLHLTVTLAGRTPFQTMVREVVPLGWEGHVAPGQVLAVRGNPDNRHQLLVTVPGRP